MPILKREADCFPADLFARPRGRPWWVAHVRSRQEKRLGRHLLHHQVPFYLPLLEKETRRRGRRRVSFLPLFPGYVFFRGLGAERLAALRSNLLVQAIEVEDQARLQRELLSLHRLQSSGAPLVPHPCIGPGDEVEIVDGPLRGFRGTVLRERGRLRLVVCISLLRRAVAAEVSRELVIPARRRATWAAAG